MSKPGFEIDGHAGMERPQADAGSDVPADSGAVFLGRLAHDLRGPLSPLQTAAYLLRRDDLGPQRRAELLDIIDRQSLRLGGMLQEVSDWMRARQGALVGHREALNVPMLIELACAQLAASGGSIDVPETLDEVEVMGDTQHLVQMFGTLLGYMQGRAGADGVRVIAALAGDLVEIVIERRAAVRASQHEPSLEHAFATLFSAPEPAPFDDGLGLRLLIARAIAGAHGGRLSADATASGCEQLRIELPVR